MFRVSTTPKLGLASPSLATLERGSCTKNMTSTGGCSYSFVYSWWVRLTPETCRMKNKRPTWCHLLFYFTFYVLNMFRILIYPSSGACDCAVELAHRSFCSRFFVCWRFGAAGFEWCPCCRLKLASACNTDTNKWNKISSDIKLVFYSSAITVMHGPINIRCRVNLENSK